MRILSTVLAAVGAAVALGLMASSAAAADNGPTVCSQDTNSFSGTAQNLIVPQGGYCQIDSATITNNLIVQHDAGADVTNSTIQNDILMQGQNNGSLATSTVGHDVRVGLGSNLNLALDTIEHDFVASQANDIGTGSTGPPPSPSGPTSVGHDFVLNGAPGPQDDGAFVFDGLCDLTVGHDLQITNRWVTLGSRVGDEDGSCPLYSVSVGHDLVESNDTALTGFFGPSPLEIGNTTVANDLIVTGNTATGGIEVSDNHVGGDAMCAGNSPSPSGDGPGDGPNVVGGTNTCG